MLGHLYYKEYGRIKGEEAVDRHGQTRYVGHLKIDRPG